MISAPMHNRQLFAVLYGTVATYVRYGQHHWPDHLFESLHDEWVGSATLPQMNTNGILTSSLAFGYSFLN